MKLRFDTSIYLPTAIDKAILDYQQIASIKAIRSGNHIVCELSGCVYPEDITQMEFSNYVLNLTVSMNGVIDDGL